MQCTFCAGVSRARPLCEHHYIGPPLPSLPPHVCTPPSPTSRVNLRHTHIRTHSVAHRMPVHRRYRYPSPAIASVFLALLCVTRIIRSLAAARRVPGAADLDKSKIAAAEVSWRVLHPRRPVPEGSAVPKGCQSADDTLRKHRQRYIAFILLTEIITF